MSLNKAGLASAALGFGPGGGGLQKLTIAHDGTDFDRNGPIEALFNPHEITRSRSVNWHAHESAGKGSAWTWSGLQQEFAAMQPATLSLELFFDTYESRAEASMWARATSLVTPPNPFQTGDATDVTVLTNRVARLAEFDKELHRPPLCTLSWGAFADIFTGVLTQISERFTMFLPDGTPVRATVSCSFVESLTDAQLKERELHSSDVHKTWVVRRNDTLHSIAAAEYRDPRLWRHIASANGIVNPRDLRPGTVLTIPRLS
ncbi:MULTISPECIES: LysM peptidoglycan-binding domain-containing protein [unclassified Solwaraspora]|uniref:CIS tube protein n=1 Tax=unclassified Solwaraspora TaxID=2627926 RepID=UPI00259B6874|nr:LysM peptidoglycan-binding domain-containing protein [Solwaraspora sp. WMMA2056]WJK43515.1 LysM peptidoglycan-binding domain-containing protein [Solwaraspora sp. WMMA2056]